MKLINEKKNFIIYFFIFFIILSIIYLIAAVFLEIKTDAVKRTELLKNEERLVGVESYVLSNKINNLNADLLYIVDNFNLYENNAGFLKILETQWISFADRKKIYDQIRFIDINGDEKIRINYDEKGSKSISNLQNKKDRYYFKETLSLKKGQIYISKLDLNVENEEIEQPIKPMIRISTPVYNDKDELTGIIILNYYAKYLLNNFKNIGSTSIGDMFLLDSNGYWIVNDIDKNKEWSFMYDDKKDISFKKEYSSEWKTINENQSGIINSKNGIFIYTGIMPINKEILQKDSSIILEEGNWRAVSFLSNDNKFVYVPTLNNIIIKKIKSEFIVFLVIFLLAAIFSILMTINKIAKNKIKYFSEYDTMTGVYNRRAGYDLLGKYYKDFIKNEGIISICFIDINGLKEVNDNIGHEAGDELILSIVNGIREFINQTDFVIRFGGDEFLIVFINKSEEQAEGIWGKINNEYNRINNNENRKYIISASHGIAEIDYDSDKSIENIINIADEKMYNEKRIIKKDLKVIKNF
ncbi:sensor domain-containing diguanylate cyclase [Anaerovorax odorimutans]|uniref:sensor domain-containing diguanylate cyclase n=1 Tax=Anaerovorax odorimutans TaxID=109327 RepID=UPI00041938F5|nr:diguanylate cyclase [Anaerovorax odorimutans]